MKRSTSITLTLFAGATLAACDDKPPLPPVKPYATVQECVTGGNTEDLCKEAFEKAMETHRATAPKFTDKEACEKGIDVDKCVQTQVRNNDGSFSDVFVPAMAGYLLGQALNRTPERERERIGYSGGYYGGVPYSTGPVYNSRTYPGGYRDSGNMRTTILNSPGARPSPPSAPSIGGSLPSSKPSLGLPSSRPSNVGTTAISRGGFGGSGGGFSSSG